jgi:hypothetical protein
MSRQLRADLELLSYANAARARTGRGLGIVVIAVFFFVCAIIEAFASIPLLAFSA